MNPGTGIVFVLLCLMASCSREANLLGDIKLKRAQDSAKHTVIDDVLAKHLSLGMGKIDALDLMEKNGFECHDSEAIDRERKREDVPSKGHVGCTRHIAGRHFFSFSSEVRISLNFENEKLIRFGGKVWAQDL